MTKTQITKRKRKEERKMKKKKKKRYLLDIIYPLDQNSIFIYLIYYFKEIHTYVSTAVSII